MKACYLKYKEYCERKRLGDVPPVEDKEVPSIDKQVDSQRLNVHRYGYRVVGKYLLLNAEPALEPLADVDDGLLGLGLAQPHGYLVPLVPSKINKLTSFTAFQNGF
jgi:hypothetical protein